MKVKLSGKFLKIKELLFDILMLGFLLKKLKKRLFLKKSMARLVFNKRSVEVKDGEPMKEYARELGVAFGCENGVCGTCQIDIVSGAENLNAINEAEEDMGRDRKH